MEATLDSCPQLPSHLLKHQLAHPTSNHWNFSLVTGCIFIEENFSLKCPKHKVSVPRRKEPHFFASFTRPSPDVRSPSPPSPGLPTLQP